LYLFLVAAVIGYDLLVEKEDKKGGDKEWRNYLIGY
jgi:hypothetical protein